VKRSIQVEIAGQRLTIRSDEGVEYVHELARFVDAQLTELLGAPGSRPVTNPQRVALLVAIQLADELFRERDLHRRFRARVTKKLATLRESLDAHEGRLEALGADPPAPPATDA
jgi:cell division protein ZapA